MLVLGQTHERALCPARGGRVDGTWACNVCTFLNTAGAQACGMCATRKPDTAEEEHASTPPTAPDFHTSNHAWSPHGNYEAAVLGDDSSETDEPRATTQSPLSSPAEPEDAEEPLEPWACAACTFVNAGASRHFCSVCATPKPAADQVADLLGERAAQEDTAEVAGSPESAEPEEPLEPWACEQCTFHNYTSPTACDMCGNSR
jgi:hypothetical protein